LNPEWIQALSFHNSFSYLEWDVSKKKQQGILYLSFENEVSSKFDSLCIYHESLPHAQQEEFRICKLDNHSSRLPKRRPHIRMSRLS